MSYIKLEEKDVQNAKIIANVLNKAQLQLQGDAIVVVGESLKWLHELIKRLGSPEELPDQPTPEKKKK